MYSGGEVGDGVIELVWLLEGGLRFVLEMEFVPVRAAFKLGFQVGVFKLG
jgi:hypothetical protein